MSRFRAIVLSLTAALGFAFLATACSSAPQVATTIPDNITQLKTEQPGASLAKYGYTPVAELYNSQGKVNGNVYVDCGTINISTCSANLNNEGTLSRPNVYVVGDNIVTLEGPHDSSTDSRSYYADVPPTYQRFSSLTTAQQKTLLGVMPAISHAIGDPSDGPDTTVLSLAIGNATVWVSR